MSTCKEFTAPPLHHHVCFENNSAKLNQGKNEVPTDYPGGSYNPCTGWHIMLIQTSRWHQNKSSVLARGMFHSQSSNTLSGQIHFLKFWENEMHNGQIKSDWRVTGGFACQSLVAILLLLSVPELAKCIWPKSVFHQQSLGSMKPGHFGGKVYLTWECIWTPTVKPASGQGRLKWNFCFDVNGRFKSTWCVTLYFSRIHW